MNVLVKNSLVDYLKLLRPRISHQLISAQHWQNIETVAQALPNTITTFFGFESRLGNPKAHADFLICAATEEMGKRILAQDSSSLSLPPSIQAHPVWNQIRQFAEQWNSKSSLLADLVHNMWLEFDVDDSLASGDRIPVPSCFFGPKPIYARSESQWTISQALKLIQDRDIPLTIAAKLSTCFELLPQDAYVFQIGVMLARQSDLVRVCIRDIAPQNILVYLTAIGWSGDIYSLRETLDSLSKYVDRIDLDIDIGETVLPKIGLECYLGKQPEFEPRWQLLLNYLVASGLCLTEKKDSLLTYPGFIRQQHNPELWPQNLSAVSSLLGVGYEYIFFQGLHHIKLTYQDSAPIEAKAYLYASKSLINPNFVSNYRTWKNSQPSSSQQEENQS